LSERPVFVLLEDIKSLHMYTVAVRVTYTAPRKQQRLGDRRTAGQTDGQSA